MEENDVNLGNNEGSITNKNDDKNNELQVTIERISKISIKKERKFFPPKRTESKKLQTYRELNESFRNLNQKNSLNNGYYNNKNKNIYYRGTLLYRVNTEF